MILLAFRHGLRASRWEQLDLIHARLHVSRGDIFEHAGMKPVRITITSGNEVTHAGHDRWHVAKTVLISRRALHRGVLRFASTLSEAGAMKDELLDFRRKLSDAGRATSRRAWRRKDPERVAEIIRGIGVREKPPMTEIESLVAGFKSDVALAVGQHRRIVGAGNVGNFCKSIDFHRQRYGAKLEGLRHQGFDGAEIDAAAAQIAQLANDAIDKAQRGGVVEFHGR